MSKERATPPPHPPPLGGKLGAPLPCRNEEVPQIVAVGGGSPPTPCDKEPPPPPNLVARERVPHLVARGATPTWRQGGGGFVHLVEKTPPGVGGPLPLLVGRRRVPHHVGKWERSPTLWRGGGVSHLVKGGGGPLPGVKEGGSPTLWQKGEGS